MNLAFMKEFFMWMTVINLVIFAWSAILCMVLKNLIVRIHGRMFGLSPAVVQGAIYGFLAVYKIIFIVCCLVPWIALLIMD